MRPYLAIIKDSFRRAIASRVLYIMLVLITVFLLGVAPLGYKERLTTRFFQSDLTAGGKLVAQLVAKGPNEPDSPEARVWAELDKSVRDDLTELIASKDTDGGANQRNAQRAIRALVDALDGLVNDLAFYDREMWEGIEKNDEAEALLSRNDDDLSEEEQKRLNRLWFEMAFKDSIRGNSPTTLQLYYGPFSLEFFPFPTSTATSESNFNKRVRSFVPWLLDTFVLSIGLLISILITAPIIPQTFEPGTLALQFSKPVSRSLLFLSKFIGGCAFTLLCVTYLFGGVWLILGARWSVWHHGIWLCVPIYVFVFMIYFSVTAIAGVIWRNTIVAVILTIVFWFSCFLLDTVKAVWEGVLKLNQFKTVVASDDNLIGVNHTNIAYRWNDSSGDWEEILLSAEQAHELQQFGVQALPPLTGPVFDNEHNAVVGVRSEAFVGQIVVAARVDDDEYAESPGAPPGTRVLFSEPGGKVIAITRSGTIFRLESDLFADPSGDATDPFQPVPISTPLKFASARHVAMNPDTGVLAVYNAGQMTLLEPDEDDVYQRVLEEDIDMDPEADVAIAFTGEWLLVARGDGDMELFRATTSKPGEWDIELNSSYQSKVDSRPRSVVASPDGGWFAINYHNGDLWLLDLSFAPKGGGLIEAAVDGQGDISAMAFAGPNDLLICNRELRVARYNLKTNEVTEYFSPQDWADHFYYKFTKPLHFVFPKPRGFYVTVTYLLLEDDELAFGETMSDPSQELHPWRPVWSGLAFVVVMLILACIYIERQEY